MPERWEQVKEILGSALEKNPSERDHFIRTACGPDGDLREEVLSLLAHHADADAILENSPANALVSYPKVSLIGRQIGAYRIVGETGQGGMAVVYEAERADQQFEKRVAIKMLKPGFGTAEIERRFRSERQTLAALDHPHIVKLLDGGATEEGWPYLVMEFVDGAPIDEFCESRRLSIRERLELFRLVCLAVGYAHRRQVIHRDLKPHNILITSDGVPRLLDFGIAKLLALDGRPAAATTIGDARPMTPEYASPEQFRGLPITSATDIYSLGVLLYRLLTGLHPYRTALSSWSEIERAICAEPSPRPSSVVLEKHRQRQLQGDLDTITLMALRKEPELRYASAEDFARDIGRYLAGLPVQARRPTLAYRTGKFLRRHREAVLTFVVVFLFGTLMAGWEAYRLKSSPGSQPVSAAVRVKGRPSVAVLGFKNLSARPDTAWISTALSEMIGSELAGGEALRIIPGEIVARSKIELKVPELETLPRDTLQRLYAEMEAEYVISGSYLDNGDGQVRLKLNLQAATRGETVASISETGLDNNLSTLAARSGTRLRSTLGLAAISALDQAHVQATVPADAGALRLYSEGLAQLRSFDALAARALFEKSIAADDAFPLAHMALASAWQSLGYDQQAAKEARLALSRAGRLPREDYLVVEARFFETSRDWEKAIQRYRALFTFFPDNLEYGLSLARAETSSGKGKDALATLAELEKSGVAASDDPRIDLARSEAGASLGNAKLRRDAAESAAAKAYKQGARLLLARARTQECRALADLGENARAGPVCEEGRRIFAETGDRFWLARNLHATAEVPLNQDDWARAESLYRQALTLTREIGDEQGTARELGNIALTYKYRGDLATAISMQKEAFDIETKIADKNGMAIQSGNIGNSLSLQGKLEEALPYYRRSLEISNEIGNRNSAGIALGNIAGVLAEKGDLNGALSMAGQALKLHRELGSKFYYAADLQMLGGILQQRGDPERARKNYEEALAVREQLGERPGAAETWLALAALDCDSGRFAEAERLAKESIPVFQAVNDPSHGLLAQILLSRSLRQQDKLPEARQNLNRALRLAGRNYNIAVQLDLALEQAELLIAEREFEAAAGTARSLLQESKRTGILQYQYECAVLLGRIQSLTGKTTAARNTLEEAAKAAHSAGFEAIARRAVSFSEPLAAAK